MAEPPPYPESGDDTGVGPDRGSPPGMPRWVKVSGIVVVVLVLLVVIVMFFVGGQHGPGRHALGVDTPGVEAAAKSGHV
jgi:hypothetical protein